MKRVVALIMVAIVLATATGVASFIYLQNAEQHVLAGLETVSVLETKATVPAGTSFADALGRGLIGPAEVPTKYASPTNLRPDSQVNTTLVAGRDLSAGRLVFDGDFVATVEVSRVLPIPDGDVAMSFPLPAANRLAPFLAPGDHVAVMDGSAGKAPEIVFTDLLVLAVGNNSSMGAGTGEGAEGLITVAVSTNAAPALLRTINGGGVYLAMLGSGK